jgi:hypothetical protein
VQFDRTPIIVATTALTMLLTAAVAVTSAQENQERLAHSQGQGTLRVGDEKFKVTSVIVKLLPDRKAEVTLGSDITIFLSARWSTQAASPQEIDLELTGSTGPGGGLSGAGKVRLSRDGKSVERLDLKGVSKSTKRIVEVDFAAK